jgi:hypothetical protein
MEASDVPDAEYAQYLALPKIAFVYAMSNQFDNALTLTDRLVTLANKYGDWNSGNAIHAAWTIRGICSIRNGDLKRACSLLLESAKVTGSPQLNSFGPNMFLAKLLLENGQVDTVVTYLQNVTTFWKMNRSEEWISVIRKGSTPDFGASLAYAIVA